MRKIPHIILTILLSICAGNMYAMPENIEKILKELDQTIEKKSIFQEEKEKKLEELKNRLQYAEDDTERYELYNTIHMEYLHYQADSALKYIKKKEELTESNATLEQIYSNYLNKAEIFGVMGMYSDAKKQLDMVDRSKISGNTLMAYYFAMRTYYGWLADNTPISKEKQFYQDKTDLYRDSVLITENEFVDKDIAKAEKMIYQGHPDEAIEILKNKNLEESETHHKAYVYYTLYSAYEMKKDVDMQIYYLAKTAIMDLQVPVREYASLQKLALLIFKKGDIKRGYSYMNCAMEDAVACNARLRFMEVTELYPAINNAYDIQEEKEHRLIRNMLIATTVMAIMLIIATFYLYYWMKKLSAMRKELYHTNKALVDTNRQLQQTGKIKETYIVRYLEKCVTYIEKLEQYRRSLEKLAMAAKVEELYKAIKSEQFIKDERKNFYTEFDKSFLSIFPTFVEDFNKLLKEDEQISLKPGEVFSTELRVFALIKLGVTDTAEIAHFLGYSLPTVYNYRSKIRNKAKGDKDNFDKDVMNL